MSSVSEERAFVCEAKARKEGDRLLFCGKPGRMTDLAPDGRARLAGKKGTDIGKVRGEGVVFLPKKSGASEENVRMRAGEFCGKMRGLVSHGSGREQSGKPLYAAAASAGERRTSL